jgi:hypothetical protein
VWSFARELASATPLLARYWGGRLRDRALRRPPTD